jgi:hypothetical protein
VSSRRKPEWLGAFHVSSISEPRLSGSGPEIVPDASRSAGAQAGAVHDQVGDLLLERPVEVASTRARDDGAVQLDLELQVVRPRLGDRGQWAQAML